MTEMLDATLDYWLDLIHEAYLLAKAERAHELERRRVKSFDGRGLHVYSEIWGSIRALEKFAPGLAEIRDIGEPACYPVPLRKVAAEDADAEFRLKLLDGWPHD